MERTARDVMTTEVITVTPATHLSEFARICAEDGISGAPVVTVDGRLVGVVSRTDLLAHLMDSGHGAAALGELGEAGLGTMPGMASEAEEEVLGSVDDIMQPEVVSVDPSTPISAVARRMFDERIHRVVVVEGRRILGIITSLDLLGQFPGAAPRAGERKRARAPAARARRTGRKAPARGTRPRWRR